MGKVINNTGINLVDSSGGTIVDNSGVVSSTQFPIASVSYDPESFTSQDLVEFTSGSAVVVFPRTTSALTSISSYGSVSSGSRFLLVLRDTINGTVSDYLPYLIYDAQFQQTFTSTQILEFGPGTHVFNLVSSRTAGASGTATFYVSKLAIVSLGR